MCVVFVTGKEKRVPDEWVQAGYDHNPAGAGIAYRDRGLVRWKKGMNLEEAREMNSKVPLPYAIHFRIPTCGGSIKKLTHPFPIETGVSLALEGQIKGQVLFHNGHWGRWKDIMLESAARGRIKIPGDKWTDSRAMAWMAAHFGMGVLDLIDEKICAFGPDHIEIYGTGWQVKDQIWCSNMGWEFATRKYEHNHSWRHTDKKDDSSSDKEDSHRSQFTTPPSSMMGPGRRYIPASSTHTPYCRCPVCEQAKEDRKKEAAGGASTVSPFELMKASWEAADRLWKMVPPKISKKKWKKAYKKFEEEERKLKLNQIRSQLREFNQNVEQGIVPLQ